MNFVPLNANIEDIEFEELADYCLFAVFESPNKYVFCNPSISNIFKLKGILSDDFSHEYTFF